MVCADDGRGSSDSRPGPAAGEIGTGDVGEMAQSAAGPKLGIELLKSGIFDALRRSAKREARAAGGSAGAREARRVPFALRFRLRCKYVVKHT